MLVTAPMYIALFLRGTVFPSTTIDPVINPAEPIPATARPTIKTTELGAAAHKIDPASNMTMEDRNMILMLKNV